VSPSAFFAYSQKLLAELHISVERKKREVKTFANVMQVIGGGWGGFWAEWIVEWPTTQRTPVLAAKSFIKRQRIRN